jgi:hypothetical protein
MKYLSYTESEPWKIGKRVERPRLLGEIQWVMSRCLPSLRRNL